jgi:hypothetical protein
MPQDEDKKANHRPKEGYPKWIALCRMRDNEGPEDEFLKQGGSDNE